MVKTYAYGFPRIGKNREYKKVIENFWKNKIDETTLVTELQNLEKDMENTYSENVDFYPSNEMTMYDKMLDTAIMLGFYDPQTVDEYYELCRGKNALEMTKWFNTNYHYLVPDLSEIEHNPYKNLKFKITGENPHLIGPFTFLKLSEGISKDKFRKFALDLAEVYSLLISEYSNVHIDEPAFAMDLTSDEIDIIKEIYDIINVGRQEHSTKVNLFTCYGKVNWLIELFSLPVDGIGFDFVEDGGNLKDILSMGTSLLKDKTLFAGNITDDELEDLLKITDNIYIIKNLSESK